MKPLILALGWLLFGLLAVGGLACFVMALVPDPDEASNVLPFPEPTNVRRLDDYKGAS